jgi:cysteine-rich repeat protein
MSAQLPPPVRTWLTLLARLATFLLSGCLEPASIECGGRYCPAGLVCSPDGTLCVTRAQVSACSGKADRAPCSVSGAAAAECRQGVCTPQVCGDGIVTGDEVCDDGNVISCDRCSADCRSDESCGNAIVECLEQCDRGAENSNDPNELCRPDCQRQRCGD